MLQLFVIFYVPGLLLGIPMRNRMLAALIAFVINYACYFSEIFRGGIESISKGQHEAGMVLGLTKKQIFSKIILLQVIKRILAPMSNEVITLVKDTSLARVIIVAEILKNAQDWAAQVQPEVPFLRQCVFLLLGLEPDGGGQVPEVQQGETVAPFLGQAELHQLLYLYFQRGGHGQAPARVRQAVGGPGLAGEHREAPRGSPEEGGRDAPQGGLPGIREEARGDSQGR